jgi:predicted enzyme related to lactoylglutathione lyase
MPDETNRERNLRAICACFIVDDIVKSAEYYRDVLGFSFESYFGEPPCFVMLYRDGVEFFFSSGGRKGLARPNHVANPDFTWDAYVRCGDVAALLQEFKSKGAQITREPQVMPYQMKEFEVKDCNGYILCFAQDVSGES